MAEPMEIEDDYCKCDDPDMKLNFYHNGENCEVRLELKEQLSPPKFDAALQALINVGFDMVIGLNPKAPLNELAKLVMDHCYKAVTRTLEANIAGATPVANPEDPKV
jgi:hypothetical protein